MHQIPYSVSRMLYHILIGFVGGTIFIASGKVTAVHAFDETAAGLAPLAVKGLIAITPLPELANQGKITPANDNRRQAQD